MNTSIKKKRETSVLFSSYNNSYTACFDCITEYAQELDSTTRKRLEVRYKKTPIVVTEDMFKKLSSSDPCNITMGTIYAIAKAKGIKNIKINFETSRFRGNKEIKDSGIIQIPTSELFDWIAIVCKQHKKSYSIAIANKDICKLPVLEKNESKYMTRKTLANGCSNPEELKLSEFFVIVKILELYQYQAKKDKSIPSTQLKLSHNDIPMFEKMTSRRNKNSIFYLVRKWTTFNFTIDLSYSHKLVKHIG